MIATIVRVGWTSLGRDRVAQAMTFLLPIVFFSMATSSGDDLPRNLEFLFSRNRLNVAISRAQSLAVLVASPQLLEIRCRTIEQMRMVNGLCRFVELASA